MENVIDLLRARQNVQREQTRLANPETRPRVGFINFPAFTESTQRILDTQHQYNNARRIADDQLQISADRGMTNQLIRNRSTPIRSFYNITRDGFAEPNNFRLNPFPEGGTSPLTLGEVIQGRTTPGRLDVRDQYVVDNFQRGEENRLNVAASERNSLPDSSRFTTIYGNEAVLGDYSRGFARNNAENAALAAISGSQDPQSDTRIRLAALNQARNFNPEEFLY